MGGNSDPFYPNQNQRKRMSSLHGAGGDAKSKRQPTKILIPSEGATTPQNNSLELASKSRDANMYRSGVGVPGPVHFQDTLFPLKDGPSSPPQTHHHSRMGNISTSIPKSSIPSTMFDTTYKSPDRKGKTRQLVFDHKHSNSRSRSTSKQGPRVIAIESDDEQAPINEPLRDGWENRAKSKHIAKQSTSKQRLPDPIHVEQSNTVAGTSSYRNPSFLTSDSPSKATSGLAQRMKTKTSPPQKHVHRGSDASKKRASEAVEISTFGSSPSNTKKTKFQPTELKNLLEIRIRHLIISDVWRACASDASLSILVKPHAITFIQGASQVRLDIKYKDIYRAECSQQSVQQHPLLNLNLVAGSPSAESVQKFCSEYDPRAVADASGVQLIPDLTFDEQYQLWEQAIEIWHKNGLVKAWLDASASKTIVDTLTSIASKPWPNGTLHNNHANSLSVTTLSTSAKQKKKIIPGERRFEKASNNVPSNQDHDGSQGDSPTRNAKRPLKTFPVAMSLSPPFPNVNDERPAATKKTKLMPNLKEKTPPFLDTLRKQLPHTDDEPILRYPYEGTGSVTLLASDVSRLDDAQFLNDTLIEFGLKLMHQDIRQRDPQLADQIYIFSSFFYKRLSELPLEKSYQNVRKWTNKVDLFSKKFIIIPINEDYHWYLAMVVNPFFMTLSDIQTQWPSSSQEKVETGSVPPPAESAPNQQDKIPHQLSDRVQNSKESKPKDRADSFDLFHDEIMTPPLPADVKVAEEETIDPLSLGPPQEASPFEPLGIVNRTTSSESETSRHSQKDIGFERAPPLPSGKAVSVIESRSAQTASSAVSDNLSNDGTFHPTSKINQLKVAEASDIDGWSEAASYPERESRGSNPFASALAKGAYSGQTNNYAKARKDRSDLDTISAHDGEDESTSDGKLSHLHTTLFRKQQSSSFPPKEDETNALITEQTVDSADFEEMLPEQVDPLRGRRIGGGPPAEDDIEHGGKKLFKIFPRSERSTIRNDTLSDRQQETNLGHVSPDTLTALTDKKGKTYDAKARSDRSHQGQNLDTILPLEETDDSKPAMKTVVITFDSLGSSHTKVKTRLREYLWMEAKDKGRLEDPTAEKTQARAVRYIQAQVPQQPNFCDCGIYLLHYFDRFFSNPDKMLTTILKSSSSRSGRRQEQEAWQSESIKHKREYWYERIVKLHEGWKALKHQKEEDDNNRSSTGPTDPSNMDSSATTTSTSSLLHQQRDDRSHPNDSSHNKMTFSDHTSSALFPPPPTPSSSSLSSPPPPALSASTRALSDSEHSDDSFECTSFTMTRRRSRRQLGLTK